MLVTQLPVSAFSVALSSRSCSPLHRAHASLPHLAWHRRGGHVRRSPSARCSASLPSRLITAMVTPHVSARLVGGLLPQAEAAHRPAAREQWEARPAPRAAACSGMGIRFRNHRPASLTGALTVTYRRGPRGERPALLSTPSPGRSSSSMSGMTRSALSVSRLSSLGPR